PQGRKPIITKIISEKELIKLKQRVLTKISQNQQVFIVTPLIEESEKMENIKSVLKEFEEICDLYPELHGQIGLLHGKLKPKEKDQIMNFFKEGKFKILVSTTVIEVGVDVPQASIMIIKNAERFGLSQLHQLRGRVGRSDIQSYCFLETRSKTPETMRRLKALEETNDGFKLAELDLHFRGAGEILGLRQSGESDLPLEILADLKFLEKVQDAAKWLLERYPNLDGLPELKARINESLGDIMA
ncbi:MAG TPA: helicase-related protein, partial [Candidatus Absconditabacterales bacterium]|nr:helicase-related protein [Candidatus Absconditabacterales bacterium]